MSTPIEAAVDATLDVTAELARVTAERDNFKARAEASMKTGLTEEARAKRAESDRDGLRFDLATATDRIDTLIEECEVWEARAEAAEKALLDVHDALHAECSGVADLPTEIRALRTERDALRAQFAVHNALNQERDRSADALQARAEVAEKANAAWRLLAERARKHLSETNHCEDCSRTDECDDADPGECGEHGLDGCPACDCGVSAWQATAAELYQALADSNLGADWVPRAELKAAKNGLRPEFPPLPPNGEGLPRYGLHWLPAANAAPLAVPLSDGYWTPWHLAQAELRRVAEAVREACRYPTRLHPVCGHVTMSYIESLDLDAIVRGTR